jgi:hypothetical protein
MTARMLGSILFLSSAFVLAADPPKPMHEKPLESKDAAKLFGANAFKKVQPVADRLFTEKNTDFVLETIETVPKEMIEKVRGMKADEKEKYFQGLVSERAKAEKLQGIHILICKSPSYLYVGTTGDAHFPAEKASKIRQILLTSLHEKKFDEGLAKVLKSALEARGLEAKE